MSKTLKTVQTVMKIGKILSTIVFVCCIIGAVACALGIFALFAASMLNIALDGEALFTLFDGKGIMGIETAYFNCIVAIIACVAEAILAHLAIKYFKNELEAGTPFTFEGAKELFRLGVVNLCVTLGISLAQGIIFGIMWVFFPDISEPDTTISITTGLWMMILSVFFKHGAEISQPKEEEAEEDVKEEIKF